MRSPSSRTKQRACSVLYRYIIRTPGSRYGLEVLHSVEHKWCASGMRRIERGHHASAPTMTKALLLGGTLLVLAERRQCQSSALCCALPLPGVRQWRRHVGLCRVSFSVFSWVFVFVKAYFYVSTSGMVSQSVWALCCKTLAALASSHDSAIHRINIQAWALSSSCELSQNIASLRPFSPTRTLAACPSLAPLYFRELCTGVFVVYSAIIFCSFLTMHCM